MSCFRLGRVEQAQKVLRMAVRLTAPDTFAMTDRDPLEAGSAVHGWLVCQIARREAEALIKPEMVSTTAPATPAPATRPASMRTQPQPLPATVLPDDVDESIDIDQPAR